MASRAVRKQIRSTVRILTVLWAVFWLGGGLIAVSRDLGTVSAGESIAMSLFVLAFAVAPVACHIWWARTHPIGRGQQRAEAVDPVEERLQQITAAADDLHTRGWLSASDQQAVHERSARLRQLVVADRNAVALGGTPSTVVAEEVDRLTAQVVGLLDAAIDAAAVAPGDEDVDARLQARLDQMQAHRRAVAEVERRQR